jgi:hypothetical protein
MIVFDNDDLITLVKNLEEYSIILFSKDSRNFEKSLMKLKKHKLVLENYHITDIINKIKPQHNTSKSYRSDADRMVYAELLQCANKYLQET